MRSDFEYCVKLRSNFSRSCEASLEMLDIQLSSISLECLRHSCGASHFWVLPACFRLKAIFHCSRFARAGGATNFNHVKNQSPGHAKKVECSSTFMACPRAFRWTKNAQVRQLQRKLSNVCSARAGKATAMENGLKVLRWRVRLTSQQSTRELKNSIIFKFDGENDNSLFV